MAAYYYFYYFNVCANDFVKFFSVHQSKTSHIFVTIFQYFIYTKHRNNELKDSVKNLIIFFSKHMFEITLLS